jgi:hypothetical protein
MLIALMEHRAQRMVRIRAGLVGVSLFLFVVRLFLGVVVVVYLLYFFSIGFWLIDCFFLLLFVV